MFASHRVAVSLVETQLGNSMKQTVEQLNININTIIDSTEKLTTVLLMDDETVPRSNILSKTLVEYNSYELWEQVEVRKNIEFLFSRTANINQFTESIYLADRDKFIASAPIAVGTAQDPNKLDWFNELMESNKQTMWSGLHNTILYGTATNSNVISYLRKVYNKYNTIVLGVLWVDINERRFYNFYKDLSLTDSGRIFIFDPQMNIISDSYLTSNNNVLNVNHYQRALKEAGNYYVDKIDGKTKLIAHTYMSRTGWTIIYSENMEDLMLPYNAMINTFLVFSGLILAVLIVVIISRSYNISLPLIELMNLMKKAASGDFNVRAQVTRDNEIGQLCGIFNVMVQDIDTLIKQVYQAKTILREAQLTSLQLQINPHFLYNTLQTIKWLADFYNANDIQKIVMSLASMFQYSINSEKNALLSDEIKNISDYVTIQKFRYESRLSVKFDIEAGTEAIRLPKLIFQPLVENAIIHGIDKKASGGCIFIRVFRKNDWIIISVRDDCCGIPLPRLTEIRRFLDLNEPMSSGSPPIGLKNIYDRCKLEFNEGFSFFIDSVESKYTLVEISLIPPSDLHN